MNTSKDVNKMEEKNTKTPEIKPAPRLTTDHDIDDPNLTREDAYSKFKLDIQHSDALKQPQS